MRPADNLYDAPAHTCATCGLKTTGGRQIWGPYHSGCLRESRGRLLVKSPDSPSAPLLPAHLASRFAHRARLAREELAA